MAKKLTEKIVHSQICDYLKMQYPNVIFTSDCSGMKLSIGLRLEAKRKRCEKYKIPDLLILHPSKDYKGLFLEIKKTAEDLFTKNGDFKKQLVSTYKKIGGLKLKVGEHDHIKEQFKTIQRLNELGYYAAFACGFEDARQLIDNYFEDLLV